MLDTGSQRILALSVVLLTLAFVACGGNEEAREDVLATTAAGEPSTATTPTADTADSTPGAPSSTATPVAELPNTSGVSLDEYIMQVCGETVMEVNSWEGGDSLRDLSAGLGFINEQMSVLEPLLKWPNGTTLRLTLRGSSRRP